MLLLLDLPFVAGALLAWSLAAPPGPINAMMAQAGARRGFWAGWIYGIGAIAGDMTMLALTGWGVLRVVEAFPTLKVVFALFGAGLMAYFAYASWQNARGGRLSSSAAGDGPERGWREFVKAYAIVTTSPFNWAWWLSAGSSMVSLFGWVTVLGFFVGLILWTIVWAGLAAAGGARVKRLGEFIGYGAAVVLALFAIIMAWYGVSAAIGIG